LKNGQAQSDPELAERLIESEEIEDDLLDEILSEGSDFASRDASNKRPMVHGGSGL